MRAVLLAQCLDRDRWARFGGLDRRGDRAAEPRLPQRKLRGSRSAWSVPEKKVVHGDAPFMDGPGCYSPMVSSTPL